MVSIPLLKGVVRIFAQWADTTLFWAAMGHSFQPKGAAQLMPDPAEAQAFANDRRAMRTNMTNLTWIWMTLLFSNILPGDHNANLPLQMYRLVCAVMT